MKTSGAFPVRRRAAGTRLLPATHAVIGCAALLVGVLACTAVSRSRTTRAAAPTPPSPPPTQPAKEAHWTSAATAFVQRGAGGGAVLDVLPSGAEVTVIEVHPTLTLVRTGDGRVGPVPTERVDAAVGRAVLFLYARQNPAGHWEPVPAPNPAGDAHDLNGRRWGTLTGMAVCSLLAAGEDPQDPRIVGAVDWLAAAPLDGTCPISWRARALAAMIDRQQDRKRRALL